MDIASHGLWGGAVFGRRSRKVFWLAFFFGVAPDLFSFGIFFLQRIFLFGPGSIFSGPPDLQIIPGYVFSLYNVTHSLVVFAAAFALIWFLRGRPLWPMAAWGFHVLLDLFTHDILFLPTPFLWPLSGYRFDGVPWSHPAILFTNLILLVAVYLQFWLAKKKKL